MTTAAPSHARKRDSVLRRSLRGSVYEALLAMPLVYLNLPANLVVAALLAEALHVPPPWEGGDGKAVNEKPRQSKLAASGVRIAPEGARK